MKLTKFEQSGFILETERGFRFGFDIARMTPIEKLEGVVVDAMLVSHIHGDHFSIDHIKKLNPKKVYMNMECMETLGEEVFPFEIIQAKVGKVLDIDGTQVELFNVDHGPNVSAPVKENFGFLFTVDSQKIYFAGDMFYESGMEVSDLEVDYALLPVGTHYTFGPEEAFSFAKKFKKIGKIISMHYEKKTETHGQFLELAGGEFEVE